MRDLSQGQSELFFLITAFLARYQAPQLHAPMDDDVAEAIGSLAATFETASRGLIYDHRPASVLAERLTTALKPVLSEAGQGHGSAFERDAAVVLRRIEEAVRDVRAVDQTNRQAFLDLLRRVMTPLPEPAEGAPERSRLILP
jgi:class 3 adenylate cyclase